MLTVTYNEYVYRTNSIQRSRGKNLEAYIDGLFFLVHYSQALHKNAQIFNITSEANALSDERTQWDRS